MFISFDQQVANRRLNLLSSFININAYRFHASVQLTMEKLILRVVWSNQYLINTVFFRKLAKFALYLCRVFKSVSRCTWHQYVPHTGQNDFKMALNLEIQVVLEECLIGARLVSETWYRRSFWGHSSWYAALAPPLEVLLTGSYFSVYLFCFVLCIRYLVCGK